MLLNLSTRFRHLSLALAIFYLLYNLTTFYGVSLYELYPSKVHNLATPFDSVIPFIFAMIVPYSWSLILFIITRRKTTPFRAWISGDIN